MKAAPSEVVAVEDKNMPSPLATSMIHVRLSPENYGKFQELIFNWRRQTKNYRLGASSAVETILDKFLSLDVSQERLIELLLNPENHSLEECIEQGESET